jgi:phosphoglycolate phosphatase
VKHVLLDLDGTLTDSREGIVRCIRHALEGVGEPCPADAQLGRYIGPPLLHSFETLFGGDAPKAAQALALYRERFATTGLFENRIYPGIPSVLAALRACGARLWVATAKPVVYAERILRHFGLDAYLEGVHGSELDGTRSDKRELIRHVLARERLPAADCAMVGDREHDMLGAAANAVRGVGALWGYGSREELLEAGAAALCEQPGDLPAALALGPATA